MSTGLQMVSPFCILRLVGPVSVACNLVWSMEPMQSYQKRSGAGRVASHGAGGLSLGGREAGGPSGQCDRGAPVRAVGRHELYPRGLPDEMHASMPQAQPNPKAAAPATLRPQRAQCRQSGRNVDRPGCSLQLCLSVTLFLCRAIKTVGLFNRGGLQLQLHAAFVTAQFAAGVG